MLQSEISTDYYNTLQLVFLFKLFDPSVNNDRLDWLKANQYCKGLGGNLASFLSREAISILQNQQGLNNKGDKRFWIGFNNIDRSNYKWSDGLPIIITNWAGGQPDNYNNVEDCAEILSNGLWNDANCYIGRGWMCKIAKGVTPPTNPIVVNETFPGRLFFLFLNKNFHVNFSSHNL